MSESGGEGDDGVAAADERATEDRAADDRATEEPAADPATTAAGRTDGGEKVAAKDTREVIMEATFRALAKHGYTDLRMRDIGEEMELTRQVIHYHYDGKNDLLASFLQYVAEQYEGSVEVPDDADPLTELHLRIDQCLFGPEFDEFTHWDRMKAYHELFAHAQNDARHQEILDEHYAEITNSIVTVVEDGIEAGVFRDVDPDLVGQFITDAIHVGRERRISLGHEDAPEETRRAIDEFVIAALLRED